MFDLTEKILYEKYYDDWGFIEPSGKKFQIVGIHQSFAVQYLKKNNLSIPKTEAAIIAKYMAATGYVRFYMYSDERLGGTNVGFSIATLITSDQLNTIKRLSSGKDKDFQTDVFDKHGRHLYSADTIEDLISALEDLNFLTKEEVMTESSIDFPREDLDSTVWNKDGNTYKIKSEVQANILTFIKRYEDIDLIDAAEEIHIVGSIGSNQYQDDADIDVHIVPKSSEGWDEQSVKTLRKWFDSHRDEYDGYINKHPIEVYIQTNSMQDMMSVGNYDLINDKWLNGPTIVDKNYDPYDDFSHVADDVKNLVKNADVLFGELKRDIIDFEVIKTAIEDMSQEERKHLLQKLKLKLGEIESDIELLYKERKGFTDVRSSMDPERALKDVEHMKQWQDDNATFKFINRYRYLKVIGALNDVLKDGEVTPDEIDQIKSVMGI